MKKILFAIIFSLVGIGLFVTVISHAGIQNIWEDLRVVSISGLALFFGIIFLVFIFFTWRWNIILNTYGYKPNFWKLFLQRTSAYAISYLTPAAHIGGEPTRIYFLNKEENIRLRDATASVIIDKYFDIVTNTFLILLAFIFALTQDFLPTNTSLILTISIGVVFFILIWFFWAVRNKQGTFSKIFRILYLNKLQFLKGLEPRIVRVEKMLSDFFNHRREALFSVISISILLGVLMVLELWVGIYILGYSVTFLQIIIIWGFGILAYAIPVPGAFGVYEGVMAVIFSWLGLPLPLAIAFVLILRLRDLTFTAIGAIYILQHGLKVIGLFAEKKDFINEAESEGI